VNRINATRARALLAVCSLVLAAIFLTAAASGAMSQTLVMKLSTATLNDTQHEWMKRFAAAIEQNTKGRIKAEVYPASQLGSIPRQIEETQLGSVQAWVGPPEFMVGLDPRFEILSAPGLFKSDAQALKVMVDPEFSKAFLALGANKGLITTTLFPSGPMSFLTRTPFRTLADIKGKKIRVLASPFQMEQLARLGATGVPLSLGDVLPAIQQGTLDGAMSVVSVFTALHYYDSAKYLNETKHAFVFSTAVLSKKWFEGIPPDLQAAVLSTIQQIHDPITDSGMDFLVAQRKVWVEKGGEMVSLSPQDEAELMQKMATVGPDVVKSKPELKPLWDLLLAAAKRSE
jgi:TRAP-type transport system periplasmic protein